MREFGFMTITRAVESGMLRRMSRRVEPKNLEFTL
jgi:hypothetical protein